MEHVQDTHRLALMNLHAPRHRLRRRPASATATPCPPKARPCPRPTLILTNPPFGTKKGGGLPTRTDFTFPTSNKQFCFLQHIYRGLKPGGRAAVVLPDNVLFEGNVGKTDPRRPDGQVQPAHHPAPAHRHLLRPGREDQRAVLHPRRDGQGQHQGGLGLRPARQHAPVRQAHPAHPRALRRVRGSLRRRPAGRPKALAKRKDTGETGRFRRFTREWIAERGDSLDIAWLKDDSDDNADDLPEPAVLAQEAMAELEGAMEELRGILAELGEEIEEVEP